MEPSLTTNLDPIPWEAQRDGHLQLSEKVAMHLREQIVSGQIRQGTFLRIELIATTLGISMTPVREGLLLLQNESLVRLIPRRGFVVNSFSKQDVLDLFWAQATIGSELARRAATRMSDAEIKRLKDMEKDYQSAVERNDEPLTDRIGHEFHRAINKAAESPRLAAMLGSLTRQLPNRFYASIEGQLSLAIEYHPIILGAIRLRDPEAAGSLMFRHINEGGLHLVNMLERRGLWDEAPVEGSEPAAQKVAKASARSKAANPTKPPRPASAKLPKSA